MKKIIIFVLVVACLVGCSKLQNDFPTTYDTEMSSQDIFFQNVAALQLISTSLLNSKNFSFEEKDILPFSNNLDNEIKELYPLAFSYPSLTKTKADGIESICSLIPSNYISELRNSILFDIYNFQEIKTRYLQSEDFLLLCKEEQEDIINYLNTVELCRNTVIETSLKISGIPITKVSGAEMRGWSEIAKDMPEEDQAKVVDVFFFTTSTLAGAANVVAGAVVAAVGMIISWLR